MLPPLAARLGLRFPGSTATQGVVVNVGDKVTYNGSKRAHYPLEAFVETSFRCLDAQFAPGEPTRIS